MANQSDYPFVLAHGIARFDFLGDSLLKQLRLFLTDLNFASDRTHYFRGIATHLRQHGFETYHSSVSFASGVEVRARELRQEIKRILETSGREKVHIIGHSMGGLDSRHMIVYEGMEDKVASLTTIGTPHWGTSFADWGVAHGGDRIIEVLRDLIDLDGFLTLTLDARKAFNESARNSEATNGVIYQTYASSQAYESVFSPIKASWRIINEAEGPNDGLVPVTSQRWVGELVSDDGTRKSVGQFNFPIPADHLNQIGWWDLEELSQIQWWRRSALKEKKRFETTVRNLYLKIAREVTAG